MKQYSKPQTFADQIMVGMSLIMETSTDPSADPTDPNTSPTFGPKAPKIV